MADNFNFKNDSPEKVRETYALMGQLFQGKEVDLTKDSRLFQAVNTGMLTYQETLELNPLAAREAAEQVAEIKAELRSQGDMDRPWSRRGARHRMLGIIPECIYHRHPKIKGNPAEQRRFFNAFPVFRVSDKEV